MNKITNIGIGLFLIPGIPGGLILNKVFRKQTYGSIEELVFFIAVSSVLTWAGLAMIILL